MTSIATLDSRGGVGSSALPRARLRKRERPAPIRSTSAPTLRCRWQRSIFASGRDSASKPPPDLSAPREPSARLRRDSSVGRQSVLLTWSVWESLAETAIADCRFGIADPIGQSSHVRSSEDRSSLCIVKDDSKGVPPARPHPAHAVPHVDAIKPTRALHWPHARREDHCLSLVRPDRFPR